MKLTPPGFLDATKLSLGIISDTHGLLRPEAVSALKGVDLILHAGDVGEEGILDELELMAPTFTVRGNIDYLEWCGQMPNCLQLQIGSLEIFMIHDIQSLDPLLAQDAALVVFGHSHQPEIYEKNGTVFLNPGSAGPRRFKLPVTLARCDWKQGQEKLDPKLIQLL